MKKITCFALVVAILLMLGGCLDSNKGQQESQPVTTQGQDGDTLEDTTGFQWTVKNGTAILLGPGDVTEPNIVIPAVVSLSPGKPEPAGYKLYPQNLTPESFPNWGSSYSMEDVSGNSVDRLQLTDEPVYLAKVLVYEPDAIAGMLAQGEFGDMEFTLRLGQIVDANNIAAITDLSKYSHDNPLQLFIRSNTNQQPYVEDRIHGTAYPVAVAGAAFYNCDFIETVYFRENTQIELNSMWSDKNLGMFEDCDRLTGVFNIPASVTVMIRTFKDCDSLAIAPELPASLQNMYMCFADCVALETASHIPEGVTNMNRAYQNCVKLQQMPEIPQTAENVCRCFLGCVSLTGTVTLPREAAHWGARESAGHTTVVDVFEGCTNLEQIVVEYCPGYFDGQVLSETVPVTFVGEHMENTLCPVCDILDGTITYDGLEIGGDGVAGEAVRELQAIWEKLPRKLRRNCHSIFLTNDIAAYYEGKNVAGLAGFAYSFSGVIYLHVDQAYDLSDNTVYHELGHCMDAYNGRNFSYSTSDDWIALHNAEGDTMARYNYSYSYYSYSLEERMAETFAMAVECYFVKPLWMQQNTPQMYAYMEQMFG